MKNSQSKDLIITLNDNQKEIAQKAIKGSASLYKQVKALFSSDIVLLELFSTKKAKEILVAVYGEEALNDPAYALTENRQRTVLGNAIHNLQKQAKKMLVTEEQADKPSHKKCVNVCNDLDLIAQNWSKYDQSEQNSIAHHLEKLIKFLNEQQKAVTKK